MEDSKFNLWRACFSFCFIDGLISPKEEQWIETKLNTLNFSESQKKILLQDLRSSPQIEKILPLITSNIDRGFLVNNIRILAKLDNELSPDEKAKIKSLHDAVVAKLDISGLNDAIAADEKASYHEDEVYKVHNKHSYIETVVKNLLKIVNPGDYKMPKKE